MYFTLQNRDLGENQQDDLPCDGTLTDSKYLHVYIQKYYIFPSDKTQVLITTFKLKMR